MNQGVLILLTLAIYVPSGLADSDQFQQWYPEYRHIFDRILRENCSSEYAYYLGGNMNVTRLRSHDKWYGGTETTMLTFPVASCIQDHSSEWMKINMASAAVLLGLTPSILAALGPSIEEMSTLFIIARRPLLGLCLGAGSPSLYPFRSIDYQKPIKLLTDQRGHMPLPRFSSTSEYVIMILEYTVAAGAIANNAHNSYELGMRVSCVFAPQLTFLPFLWAFLGFLAHLFGSWALWLRVDCERPYRTTYHWIKVQFTPIARTSSPRVKTVDETLFSAVVSAWVTIYIAGHIIFGTLTFSSLIFITVRDAVGVIGRFLGSLLVCRGILMYELAVLRDSITSGMNDEAGSGSEVELRALRVKGSRTYSETC